MDKQPDTTPSTAVAGRLRGLLAVLVAGSVVAGIVAITASRTDDSALFHGARNASDWGHHVIRIERAESLRLDGAAQVLTDPGRAFRWLIDGDHDFPPLLHAGAALLGLLFGHDSATAQRTGLVWLLLLVFATAWVGWSLADPARAGPRQAPTQAGGSRLAVAAAAGAGAALVPAHHAAALNYYYDLPMTALLWLMVAAVLALQRWQPVLPGLAGGIGVFVAALMKWTALPAGGPLLLGALATATPASDSDSAAPSGEEGGEPSARARSLPVRARILSGIVAATSCLLLLLMYWRQSPRSWNRMLSMTYGSRLDPGADFPGASWLTTVSNTLGRGLDAVVLGDHLQFEALVWYVMRFTFCFLSPLLTVAFVLLALSWLRTGARGAALVGTLWATHTLVVLGVFTSLDERFLLSLGPAVALVGALGWAGLPGGLRQAVGVAVIALGLWVAWDFHHASPTADPGPGGGSPSESTSVISRIWTEIEHERRGLGLQSGADTQWGWVRADYVAPTYFPEREFVWARVVECGATVVLAQEELMADGYGDAMWWTYRLGLARLRSDAGIAHVLGFEDQDVHRLAGEEIALSTALAHDRVVAISRGDGSGVPPGPLASGWKLAAVIAREAPEGPRHLALWTASGSARCSQWRDGPVRLQAKRLPEPRRP